MKYTYKKIYSYAQQHTGFDEMRDAINKAMNGDSSTLLAMQNPESKPVFIGGTFYPESGNLEDTDLLLTDYQLIYANRDYNRAFINDFMKYVGKVNLPDAEYIGKWSDDIDKNAHIYYIIDGNTIRKFIMTRNQEMTFTNANGISDIQFIVNMDGKMADCILDDGDLLFTDYDEAFQYLMDNKDDKYKKETISDK